MIRIQLSRATSKTSTPLQHAYRPMIALVRRTTVLIDLVHTCRGVVCERWAQPACIYGWQKASAAGFDSLVTAWWRSHQVVPSKSNA